MEGEAMKLLYYSLSQVIAVIQAVTTNQDGGHHPIETLLLHNCDCLL